MSLLPLEGRVSMVGELASVAPDLCAIDVFGFTERAEFQGFTSERA